MRLDPRGGYIGSMLEIVNRLFIDGRIMLSSVHVSHLEGNDNDVAISVTVA